MKNRFIRKNVWCVVRRQQVVLLSSTYYPKHTICRSSAMCVTRGRVHCGAVGVTASR